MQREKIAEDIYVFISDDYAQVTASAVLTVEGAVLIDTLFFPHETEAIRTFVEDRHRCPVRYVINTHYHADHTLGTYQFPGAQVIAHRRCAELLSEHGSAGLEEMRNRDAAFAAVEIVAPDITFAREHLDLRVGNKTMRLMHMPGHSPDLIGVHLVELNYLFASDNVMPVPTLMDGNFDDLVNTLNELIEMEPDIIIQGHGYPLLRGEVRPVLQENLKYLHTLRNKVTSAARSADPDAALAAITIESCGKSRVTLNGLGTELHRANVKALYASLQDDADRDDT